MYSSEDFEIKEDHTSMYPGHAFIRIEIKNIESLPAMLKRLHEMGYDLNNALNALQEVIDGHEATQPNAEELAKFFHETYEHLAPAFAYETRKESAVAWEHVPENNKALMIAVASSVITWLRTHQ